VNQSFWAMYWDLEVDKEAYWGFFFYIDAGLKQRAVQLKEGFVLPGIAA